METERLAKHLGAKIHGIDLSKDLTATEFTDIYQAFLDHLVLVFPDQELDAEQLVNFSNRFGDLEPPHPVFPSHPEDPRISLILNDADHPPENDQWHTDVTWRQSPPLAGILHAKKLPPSGGDTMWCSMYAVYEALPESDKERFRLLNGVHTVATFADSDYQDVTATDLVAKAIASNPPVHHPMISTHPETEKPILFVNEGFTTHIAELTEEDSSATLQRLWKLIDHPEFRVRVKWEFNTLVVWDNRCTQHFAMADYHPNSRRLHRISIKGDIPQSTMN